MCAFPRPLNPTTATLTVSFRLGSALALSAAGNATELIRKCLRSTLCMISPSPDAGVLLIRGRARRLRVLLVQLCEPGPGRTGMNDHAVAEPRVLPRLDGQAAVLRLVVEEIAHAERIDRVQPVATGVPVGGMPRIARMIHHHDADLFSIELARIVHPFRPLAPHVRLP